MESSLQRSLRCATGVFALMLAGGGAPVPAQDGAPTLRVQSQVVVLDVVVTDARGSFVPNLKKDDFTVDENGIPQKIASFDVTDGAPGSDSGANAPPLTILVLDELDTPFEQIAFVRDCARRYLKSQPPSLITPTILLGLDDAGLHALTQITRSRDDVVRAMDKQEAVMPRKLMRGDVAEQVASSLATLQQAALFSRGVAGRKNLIWMGRSFPSVDPTRLTAFSRTLLSRAVRTTMDVLLASRVSLTVVDPTVTGSAANDTQQEDVDTLQLEIDGTPTDPFASNFNMRLFVDQTGGKYFRGRNDLERQIAESEQRGLTFYTLSYVPRTPMQAGAYRAIRVRVRDPRLIVQSKRGYFVEEAEATPTRLEERAAAADLRFDLYEAAVTGLPYTGVHVRFADCAREAAGATATCSILVDTGSLTFTTQPGGEERTTVLVTLASLDRKGKLLGDTVSRSTIAISPEQAAGIPQGRTRLQVRATMPPEGGLLRVVVRDASGRIGTDDFRTVTAR